MKLTADNKLQVKGKVLEGGPSERVHAMMYPIEVRTARNISHLSDYFTFGFVRNPWVRLISCYKDKVVRHINRIGADINSFAARRRKGEAPLDHALLEDMLLYLINKTDLDTLNTHVRPQSLMLGIPVIQYDYLLPIEHVNEQIAPVLQYLRNHSEVEEVLVGEGYDKIDDPQKSSSVISAREWLPDIDPELIEKFYKIYESDFKIMNYSNFTDPNFPYPLNYAD